MMNRLRELEAAESREVQRILRETTAALRPHVEQLQVSLDTLVHLDTVYARARYATEVNAHTPELLPANAHGLTVVQGRHPLLLATGEDVIPFDLHMEDGERTL